MAVTVLVLQPLAVERGAAGRPAEQEAAGPRVPGRPDQVHDPLEAEHRVEDVERDHRDVAGAVGGRGGDPRRHRAGLVDALLQHLAVRRLAVVHQLVGVLGLVELTGLAEDAELAEHALHPERSGLVRHDRHHVRADGLVAQQGVQDPDERHGGGDLPARRAAQLAAERAELGHRQRLRRPPPARRQVPAEGGPPLPQVGHLLAVVVEAQERQLGQLLVGQRQAEPVPEPGQGRVGHVLLLVGDVLALARFPHPVALDGLGQDDGGLAGRPHRGRSRRRRSSPGRGRRGSAPRSRRRSSPRPSRAAPGTCRRTSPGRTRRSWT